MTTTERGSPSNLRAASRFFSEPVRDYVAQCAGRPVSVLQAGCLAPLRELGIGELADDGFEISVTAVAVCAVLLTCVGALAQLGP